MIYFSVRKKLSSKIHKVGIKIVLITFIFKRKVLFLNSDKLGREEGSVSSFTH